MGHGLLAKNQAARNQACGIEEARTSNYCRADIVQAVTHKEHSVTVLLPDLGTFRILQAAWKEIMPGGPSCRPLDFGIFHRT